jgi:hypothetical protein
MMIRSYALALSVLVSVAGFSDAATEEVFPQFAAGPEVRTSFTVHNPEEVPLTLTVELYKTTDMGGGRFFEEDVDLGARGTRTLEFQSDDLVVGCAKLSSEDTFSATAFLQLYSGGELAGQVGVPPGPVTSDFKIFGYRNPSTKTNTGIALANPSSLSSVQVTARQLDQAGSELAKTIFILQPEQHLARNINQPPFFEGTKEYEGTVEFETTAPVVPLALATGSGEINLSSTVFGTGGLTIGGPGACRGTASDSTCRILNTLTGPEEPLSRQGLDICFTIESTPDSECSADLVLQRAVTSTPQSRRVSLGEEFSGSFCDYDVTFAEVVRVSGSPKDCLLALRWRVDSIAGR